MLFWPRRFSTTPKKKPIRNANLHIEELECRSLLNATLPLSGTLDNLQINSQSYDQNHIIVKWTSSPPPESSQVVSLGAGLYRVNLQPGATVEQAVAFYETRRGVEYASPDYQVSLEQIPNDSRFSSLYGMNNTGQTGGTADADIDAPEAWDITTGSSNMVVAVIDTGVDYNHQDLAANMWKNAGEIAGNAVDDDGNGFVDDIYGYDFVNNDGDPMDDNNHGTHVAGTIGAVGNNGIGVAGVNWNVKIMALKFLGANGSGSLSNAVRALNYAVQMGAKVSNNSWGGGGFSQTLADAINNARAQGHIFVAAAGNAGSNNDSTPSYPANYNYNNVVSVAATNNKDTLASFSNYGATTVDLAAPGVGILSTTRNNTYSSFSGTSMATPHVAGAMALVWSKNPTWTYSQVIAQVLNSVDKVASLTGKVATGGRLNLFKAVSGGAAVDQSGPQITSVTFSGISTTSLSSARITFSEAINPSTFNVDDIAFTGPNGSTIAITNLTPVSGTNNTQFDATFASQSTGGTYRMVIGPTIADVAGNLMDQNQNGTKGETPGDQFTATANLSGVFTFSSTTKVAIPDQSTVTATININQDLTIQDLNVRLGITHTYDSDLVITLIAPDGTRVNLVNRRGASGDNFSGTVLNDEATKPISLGVAPFSATFKPEQLLSAFDGKNARGTWKLEIKDVSALDVGTLSSWSLIITGSPITTTTRGLDSGNESGSVEPSNSSDSGTTNVLEKGSGIASNRSSDRSMISMWIPSLSITPSITSETSPSSRKEAISVSLADPLKDVIFAFDDQAEEDGLSVTDDSSDSTPVIDMFSISIL